MTKERQYSERRISKETLEKEGRMAGKNHEMAIGKGTQKLKCRIDEKWRQK